MITPHLISGTKDPEYRDLYRLRLERLQGSAKFDQNTVGPLNEHDDCKVANVIGLGMDCAAAGDD